MAIQVEDKTQNEHNLAAVMVKEICEAHRETGKSHERIVEALVNTLHPKEAMGMLQNMLGDVAFMLSVDTKGPQPLGNIMLSLLFGVLTDTVELALGKTKKGKDYGPMTEWVDVNLNGGGN